MKLRAMVMAILAMLVLTGTASLAQRQGGARGGNLQRPGGQRAGQGLGLTPDQMKQLQPIVQKYHSDVAEIAKSSSTPDEKRTKIADLKTKAAADINAILTPEQRDKAQKSGAIDKLLSIRAAVERRIVTALAQLNLTEDQKTKVKAIFQDNETQVKAVRQDTSLTPDAKRAKIEEIRKATHEKIMAILTPEQQQKLKEIMQKRQGAEGGNPAE